jgi:predicted nucleic acid-binding protein
MRPQPDAAYVAWLRYQDPQALYISVLTLGELHFGVAQLNDVARERELKSWIADVERRFADRIVVLDDIVARQWGYLRAGYPASQVIDTQLAATALAHDFIFATRNLKHFRFDGLRLVNPWAS